jgi:hypothetical protein
MLDGFDPGALLARYYDLPRGPRVCLRLARVGDVPGLMDLFARQGMPQDGLELARVVRSDPRRRLVICATALIGSVPTVLGVGAVSLGPGGSDEPDLLVVDEGVTDGLAELLAAALRGRARALVGAQAA